ncbi:MAG: alpha/beta hydrolase [Treponema sp.]|nr:alpha/beta hydrolase [Treponema sp.]
MPHIQINEKISLFYEEYGQENTDPQKIIISAQVGFYPKGMQQHLATLGYHVYCVTLRGFHPSTLVEEDYGEHWYDVFADDVAAFADKLKINKFIYMGASHGAGVGWHLMLRHQDKVSVFVAVVGGPHSLAQGTMSYRQMLAQGIIKEIPPFNPPVDNDPARQARRDRRSAHIAAQPPAPELERKVDYGRPLMALGSEEKLCEELKKITLPVLMIGGVEDPISTPELMIRTAKCLPHCKLVIYSNCGHDIDTDLIEETCDVASRFIENAIKTNKWYLPVQEQERE